MANIRGRTYQEIEYIECGRRIGKGASVRAGKIDKAAESLEIGWKKHCKFKTKRCVIFNMVEPYLV